MEELTIQKLHRSASRFRASSHAFCDTQWRSTSDRTNRNLEADGCPVPRQFIPNADISQHDRPSLSQ